MKKRRKKRTNSPQTQWLPLLVCGLLIPVAVNYTWNNGDLLEKTGQRAAVVFAALNMPEGGLAILEERFRSQLYSPAIYNPELEEDKTQTSPSTIPDQESTASQPDTSANTLDPLKPTAKPPKIPAEYQAPLVSEQFATSGSSLIAFGAGYIKNDTRLDAQDVTKLLEKPMSLNFTQSSEPQVLILHTHATESFERYDTDVYDIRNTWRSRDNNSNMVAVGAALAGVLEERGIGVIHDTTQHDYPSYNGSYDRSAETIRKYLEEYPSIKIVLDLHRDAMERDNQTIVKPVTVIDGKKAAQVMIISACDDGTMGIPQYPQNLRFAANLQSYIASSYPDLTRPIFFCYRKYNMDLSPGSLLIEFGSNANTLEEAVYSATLVGEALVDLIGDYTESVTTD